MPRLQTCGQPIFAAAQPAPTVKDSAKTQVGLGLALLGFGLWGVLTSLASIRRGVVGHIVGIGAILVGAWKLFRGLAAPPG
jgi:hypothetical protein